MSRRYTDQGTNDAVLVATIVGNRPQFVKAAAVSRKLRESHDEQWIPVAHVEAGMRSFDRGMPEELNRVLADHASNLLFCSTTTAVDNLAREGIRDGVHLAGDVMADVALAFLPVAEERSTALADNGVEPGEYLLMTVHRAGNVDVRERLTRVVELAERLPVPAVFPVHPRTRARL